MCMHACVYIIGTKKKTRKIREKREQKFFVTDQLIITQLAKMSIDPKFVELTTIGVRIIN